MAVENLGEEEMLREADKNPQAERIDIRENPKAERVDVGENPEGERVDVGENPEGERVDIGENPEAERPPEVDGTGPNEAARFWRLAATMLGLIWNLLLPIVGGVLLGSYLGRRLGHSETWTAALLLAGVAISLYNLYRFLFEGMQR
jgi:hypothetical protein